MTYYDRPTQYSANNRRQPDFGKLALASAADARRYVAIQIYSHA
jgi:hypothetical protein